MIESFTSQNTLDLDEDFDSDLVKGGPGWGRMCIIIKKGVNIFMRKVRDKILETE